MRMVTKFLLFFLIYDFKVLADGNRNWWKYTTIYEVYIWSFKDSDGDGIGDLKGLTSKLDHFVDLGIETVWISPFFKSPMNDLGYDVSDFLAIDSLFGTMKDFEELLYEAKKRGLKIMIDFVINHTSDEHPWFEKSVNKIEPYTDFYVWHDAKGHDKNGNPVPPNNWPSLFGGSGWKWNERRKQFYLHQFSDKQPDLNLRNCALKAELKNMAKFWFKKGVAAARLDAVMHFIEDRELRDEPLKDFYVHKSELEWNDFNHIYMVNLWETYEFIHELREFVDQNFEADVDEKILIVEAYTDLNDTMLYYGKKDYKIVHFPFNFGFVRLDTFPNAKKYDSMIRYWLDNMPVDGVANWVSENHDNMRTANYLNEQFADITLMTILMLPGVACIYYGQEIGMVNNKVRDDQRRDPNNDALVEKRTRDGQRLPMQWDDSFNAGFSSNPKPWLPVHPNYWKLNVERQKHEPNSHYNLYKTLSQLRRTKTLKHGDFKSYFISPWVYAFSRNFPGERSYITIINLGTETEFVQLGQSIPNLPSFVKVVAATVNTGHYRGKRISTKRRFPREFIMRPTSAIVVST